MTTFTQYWQKHRIDALADALSDWRDESDAVQAAYDKWSTAAAEDAALAYAAYAAALDREERASSAYAAIVHGAGSSAGRWESRKGRDDGSPA